MADETQVPETTQKTAAKPATIEDAIAAVSAKVAAHDTAIAAVTSKVSATAAAVAGHAESLSVLTAKSVATATTVAEHEGKLDTLAKAVADKAPIAKAVVSSSATSGVSKPKHKQLREAESLQELIELIDALLTRYGIVDQP